MGESDLGIDDQVDHTAAKAPDCEINAIGPREERPL
jgi:hypothetical protein